MQLDKILVGIISILGITFTYWFFLGKKEDIVSVKDTIDIKVEGGYNPNQIAIPQGKTTKINFTRTDSNTCLEEVVLSDFKIKKYLPLNKKVSIEITPKEKGEFTISCGMNMFHGKIIVK
jgi:plastocyanin domain-containing protein